ncbi:MAG: hypothetical protein Ct9H300mP8_12980 [Gammaproteobacteria bacterium]|nr:MAG: hypothetical protein Ct9H300mP8_12980 [Gammaproteobacteria bacterium]
MFTPKREIRDELALGMSVIRGGNKRHSWSAGWRHTMQQGSNEVPVPGFERVKPQVFAGLFPGSSEILNHFGKH